MVSSLFWRLFWVLTRHERERHRNALSADSWGLTHPWCDVGPPGGGATGYRLRRHKLHGHRLEGGTGAIIRNFIVTGFARSAVEIDDAETFAFAEDGRLSFAGGIVDHNCFLDTCIGQFVPDDDDDRASAPIVMGSPYVAAVNPMLAHPYDRENPDFISLPMSPAVNGVVRPDIPPYNGFFELALCTSGAVGGPQEMWWQGGTGLRSRASHLHTGAH